MKNSSIEFKGMQDKEQFVDGEMYVLMESLRGGARTCLSDTDPH